jgi:hypothetical protein
VRRTALHGSDDPREPDAGENEASEMLEALLLAGMLLAHGLIHVGFVSARPPATADGPRWPFTTERSWLLDRLGTPGEVARSLALALVALTVASFALAAIVALAAVPGLWTASIAIGSVASLVLLIVFFDPWLVIGIGIDAVLLWATFVAGWAPASASLA